MNPQLPTKWEVRFLRLAALAASWSKDPSTQVGYDTADQVNRVVSLGFNGLPRGIADDARLRNRGFKYPVTLHAEENALMFARQDLSDCIIYTTHHPCTSCASKIIQAGIKKVCFRYNEEFLNRWGGQLELAQSLFEEARVEVIGFTPGQIIKGNLHDTEAE